MFRSVGEITKTDRRYDIDWLRVLTILAVFLFHCARFFNDEDWHVKNNERDLFMSVMVSSFGLWIMPIMFFISGEGSYFALGLRSIRRYVGDRFKRLVIPLLMGIFVVVVPLQVYYERLQHSQFDGSFIDFYPHYFEGFYGFGGNFGWVGLHLWFLEYLFVLSLISLPIFICVKKDAAQRRMEQVTAFINKPGMVLLFAVPLIIIELLVNLQRGGIGARIFGGWSLVQYLALFNLGYMFASNIGFQQAVERDRRIALVVGIAASILYLSASYYSKLHGQQLFAPFWKHIFEGVFRPSCSWLWLIAILGYGGKYLRFNNRALQYANEAVLPFYILHQTVIVALGYHIADWNAAVMVKYLIISSSSFVIIVALYEVIRRVGWLRFLFGMKK